MKKILPAVLVFAVILLVIPAYAGEPRVEIFSPQSTAKGVRQVRAAFSDAMVPFGDPGGLLEPFEIDCPGRGAARWADGKNWIYDFDQDLPGGVRCEFRLKPGLKTLAGIEFPGGQTFSFSTGGPAILNSIPREDRRAIDENQIFILTPDTEPDRESVLQNVYFLVEGLKERMAIRIVEGGEREKILAAKSGWAHRRSEGQDGMRAAVPPLLIQSRVPFPADARVYLVWGTGVLSKTAMATDRDQVLAFQTRPAFSVSFKCERENAKSDCIPITPISVNFTSPVSLEAAREILLRGPDGKIWKPRIQAGGNYIQAVSFPGPFPQKTTFRLELPSKLTDDSGRLPVNADKFPLSVTTDRYPPLAKFSSRFGILERNADPVLPVTLRNVERELSARMLKVGREPGIIGRVAARILNLPPETEDIQAWLRKVASSPRESSLLKGESGIRSLQVPKPLGASAFEVVGIPLKKPGLYIVELESAILGAGLLDPPGPMFVPAAVLVTNLAVHFKEGRESSLVWVTTLDTAEPVKGAQVTVRDCRDRILWQGKTDAEGLARIAGRLPANAGTECTYRQDENHPALRGLDFGHFIVAQIHDDMSFVHSSWNQGIEPWRFQLPTEDYRGPVLVHTIFDRTLFRAGQTVHMKHILRRHTGSGFSAVPPEMRPETLVIEHFGSEEKYEFPLQWDSAGIAENSWSIPRNGKLGAYSVTLRKKSGPRPQQWGSGEFRVEEFRVPLLRATIQPPAEPLIGPGEVPLDLTVQYLAGGGAGLLPVKLRGEIRPKHIPQFEGFESFTFGNGPVSEGVVRRGGEPEEESDDEGGREPAGDFRRVKLPGFEATLDRSGSARTSFPRLPLLESPKELFAEMEFRDPNGEIQTAARRVALWPSAYLAGLRLDDWVASKENLKFQIAVLDLDGKPVAGAHVKAELFERKTMSHRKRLVGGFYAYEHAEETCRVGSLCEGKTESTGLLICEAKSPVSGNVIVQAESADPAGRRTIAHRDLWVAGDEHWWFAVGDHDRIDVIPEKKRYEPGEKAALQVRMPFREATALVTVEREGVMEARIQKLSGKNPIVELPVKGTFAPNVFVSVLAVRGRVSEVQPTALVDLGRPAYKLGIAEIHVGWREHELQVAVSADRKTYRVRQKALVQIAARTWNGKLPPPGSEVALAAVDEGLLELMPNRSWNVVRAMMGRRGYGVRTATAQGQVVGKRHFGLKALPPGGGGGRQATRELFDTLLVWKGRIPLDERGEATAEIPLNDSLTSFKIVAVATGGNGLFGTGSTSIQTTQDLMILSGLPPLMRQGDRFPAGFTVRNATIREMQVDFSAKVQEISKPLAPYSISLGPGEAREIGWNVAVPDSADRLTWELVAQEKGSPEKDRLKVIQKVAAATPVRTVQTTIAQVEKEIRVPVERPRESIPGKGGIQVVLRPQIAGSLKGVNDYMRWYPYGCMEQKISVAAALRDPKLWKGAVSQIPAHLDSDGLVKYFPACRTGCETLTSYILAVGQEAGWSLPKHIREKMEGGLKKFIEGSLLRTSPFPTADLAIRKLAAMEALSRYGKFETKMLNSISIEPNLWPTSAVLDWLNLLKSAPQIPNRAKHLGATQQILRSRLNFQGATMGFSTEASDRLWWLMVSTDERRAHDPGCPSLRSLEGGYAPAHTGSISPPEGREMGLDSGECMGRPGNGEIFQGL